MRNLLEQVNWSGKAPLNMGGTFQWQPKSKKMESKGLLCLLAFTLMASSSMLSLRSFRPAAAQGPSQLSVLMMHPVPMEWATTGFSGCSEVAIVELFRSHHISQPNRSALTPLNPQRKNYLFEEQAWGLKNEEYEWKVEHVHVGTARGHGQLSLYVENCIWGSRLYDSVSAVNS